MSALLEIIKNANRPFKTFEVELGDGRKIELKTRALSAIETDKLTAVFNDEFERVSEEMETGQNNDLSILRRQLGRQSKEALAKMIVKASRIDYLQEASSELDDAPFTDERVRQLADEKQDEDYKLLIAATEEEVLDKAIEYRAFIVATIKATDKQNLHFVQMAVYNPDETPGFADIDEVGQLDRETIALFINSVNKALRGAQASNPLKSRAKKESAKRSSSAKSSEAE